MLLVLADGAGGTGHGRSAADEVVAYAERTLGKMRDPADPKLWARYLKPVDESILQGGSGGETTAVLLWLTSHCIAGASVGDSVAWLITQSGHVDMTQHQRRKPLVGSGEALPVPFAFGSPQGRLLMASDGLIKYAPADDIRRVVLTSTPDRAPRCLIDLVRLRSGKLQDDVGVIFCWAV